jgi:hypothetical protein
MKGSAASITDEAVEVEPVELVPEDELAAVVEDEPVEGAVAQAARLRATHAVKTTRPKNENEFFIRDIQKSEELSRRVKVSSRRSRRSS